MAANASAAIPVRRHRRGAALGRPRPVRQRASSDPGEGGAGERDHEGQHRRAADRRPALGRQPGLAHRQPAPREAAPGPAVPERLGGNPPARHRERPPAQVEQQPLGDGEHREDERRGDGERDPGVPGQVDDPGEQREEEGEAEDEADGERGAQRPAGQGDDEQRGADDGERPDTRPAGTRRRAAGRRPARRAAPSAAAAAATGSRAAPRPGRQMPRRWSPWRPVRRPAVQ